jgi:hypothetical protein
MSSAAIALAPPGAGPDPLAGITALGLATMLRGFPLGAPGQPGEATLGQFGTTPPALLAAAAVSGRLLLHVPPGRMAAALDALAGLPEAGRVLLLREEGAEATPLPSVAIPPPALLADAGTPDPAAFAAGEAPEKRRMVCVLHNRLDGQRIPHARDIAYAEFLRWEIAGWLDSLAPKFNLHWIALRSGPGQDDNKANLDTAMRMRFYAATHVHYGPRPLAALRDALAGASLCVTTHPEVAGLAFAMGVPPLLLATAAREGDGMAALLGPLVLPALEVRGDGGSEAHPGPLHQGPPLQGLPGREGRPAAAGSRRRGRRSARQRAWRPHEQDRVPRLFSAAAIAGTRRSSTLITGSSGGRTWNCAAAG